MRALVLLALVASGCALDIGDGALRCNDKGGAACPRGFHCAVDQTCWRDGHDPATGDGGAAGVTCAVDTDCALGHCVDGWCCNTPCDRACEVCDSPGKEGTCTPVAAGQPTGNRSCMGTGECAGACDGTSPECVYPTSSVRCGAGCSGSCDGNGACSGALGTPGGCPDGFACGTGGCKTSCQTSNDCQPNFTCNPASGSCDRVPESNCFDGKDNNGDGNPDCADPSCAPVATCVAAPDTGAALGLAFATAAEANLVCNQGRFGAVQPLLQGLTDDGCQGCQCQTVTMCAWRMDFYTGDTMCSTNSSTFDFRLLFPSGCTSSSTMVDTGLMGDGNRSLLVGAADRNGYIDSCKMTNTAASAKPPRWTSNGFFCPVVNSAGATGCAGNKVCAPVVSGGYCEQLTPGGACGTSYTKPFGATAGIWYGGASDTRSCSCSTCTGTAAGTCPTTIPPWTAFASFNCTSGTQSGSFAASTSNQCIVPGNGSDWGGTVWSTYSATAPALPGATCSFNYTRSGTLTPAQQTTVCCY